MKGYQRILEYLYGLERFGIKLDLSNTLSMLEHLGNPHRKFPSIHVAGTNGKGSVAAILQAALSRAGYRTGLYTSPHVIDFRERIRIGTQKIAKKYILSFISDLKQEIETHRYTFFEVTTALAFSYFAQKDVDIAVVETGLGGRLDSTNVLLPEVVIITTLSLDHTRILGSSLRQIAFEKAGVIKTGVPTVAGSNKKEALDVIRSICKEQKSKFLSVGKHCDWAIREKTLQGSIFSLRCDSKKFGRLEIRLPGDHQVENAAAAILALQELKKKGWRVTDRSIREGLKRVAWKARFETFRKRPLIILDVAHNPEGIKTLVKTLDELLPHRKVTFIFGVMSDKDYPLMLEKLSHKAESIILTRPDYHRSASTQQLEKAIRKLHNRYRLFERVKDAYSYALQRVSPSDAICVTGSHFTVGEFLALPENSRRKLR
jgi:dihydrofolate synthase/folylpolyglutamate synthase